MSHSGAWHQMRTLDSPSVTDRLGCRSLWLGQVYWRCRPLPVVYTHVSDTMRADLKQALQARWEASLRDRAAISPHSPVPLLDGLLAPYRATREKMISQIPPTPPRGHRAARVGNSHHASDLA